MVAGLSLERLILHISVVILPVFIYEFFHLEILYQRHQRKHQIVVGVLGGISAILTMTFPILIKDFMWDLRNVPIMLSAIYGGPLSWTVTSIFVILYRFYLGQVDFSLYLSIFIIHIAYSLPPLFLHKRYFHYNNVKKAVIMLSLGITAYFVVVINLYGYLAFTHNFSDFYKHNAVFFIFLFFLQVLGIMLTVGLIENMIDHMKMRAEVQKSEKLNIISELAASVAHEVRNPLTVVRGFIQLARERMDEKNKEYMTMVLSELDRAESIISDYLNFAKPQVEHVEKLDVGHVLEEIILMLDSFAVMKNVQLYVDIENHLSIRADKIKFKQVIMNVVKNASEAISGSGDVTVRAMREGNQVTIKITDNGLGMTNDQIGRLGSPFYSLKQNGTGLGLMVTFRFIEAMHGTIQFESELGNGTTAVIRLPIYTE